MCGAGSGWFFFGLDFYVDGDRDCYRDHGRSGGAACYSNDDHYFTDDNYYFVFGEHHHYFDHSADYVDHHGAHQLSWADERDPEWLGFVDSHVRAQKCE